MKSQEVISVAIAETSVIVRSGLVSVLKRLPDLDIQTVEITSKEGLQHCMEAHSPHILIINPQFEGWFEVDAWREHYPQAEIKVVALLCAFVDANRLKGYDDTISLYDDIESLEKKIAVCRSGRFEPARKRNNLLCSEGHDQQGNSRKTVHLSAYGDYASPEHNAQAADSFCRRSDHLCHSE